MEWTGCDERGRQTLRKVLDSEYADRGERKGRGMQGGDSGQDVMIADFTQRHAAGLLVVFLPIHKLLKKQHPSG